MTEPSDASRPPALLAPDTYSPRRRTALLLTGTGTAGAYHAGVLRALHEAGVKIDIVAGRGIGVVGALFAAVDGAQRLWDEKGFWKAADVASLYAWRIVPRIVAWALALSVAIVTLPIAAVAVGLVVFPIDFVMKMVGAGGAAGLVGSYVRFAEAAFAPEALPTWLPRLVVLVLGAAAAIATADGWMSEPRRGRGPAWWRATRPPLSSRAAIDWCWRVMWDLVRGAAALQQPPPSELGRRYAELLAENLGQPGFREMLITAHDVDAHRDLIFAPDAYWRGETHRLGDRPASLIRLIDELIDLGVEQIVLVSAAPETPGPHALAAPRLDPRARLGEYLQSSEAAVVRDATTTTGGVRIFTIRPAHNPIGPFDFAGGYDDGSRRRIGLAELMNRGYEDAYHQFVEPVVGASGERVGL